VETNKAAAANTENAKIMRLIKISCVWVPVEYAGQAEKGSHIHV